MLAAVLSLAARLIPVDDVRVSSSGLRIDGEGCGGDDAAVVEWRDGAVGGAASDEEGDKVPLGASVTVLVLVLVVAPAPASSASTINVEGFAW
jgi:hypothetical protein